MGVIIIVNFFLTSFLNGIVLYTSRFFVIYIQTAPRNFTGYVDFKENAYKKGTKILFWKKNVLVLPTARALNDILRV